MDFNLLRQVLYKMSKRSFQALIINCIFVSALYAADLNAQQIRSVREVIIDMKVENANLFNVFNDIENRTNYSFSFKKEDIDPNILFSGKFHNASVAEVLLNISKKTDLKFMQVNNNIHISKIEKNSSLSHEIEVIIQGIEITGRVTSQEDNSGLPGVNVIVKGTAIGTVTDLEGNYMLEVPSTESILTFSSVGYVSTEVSIGNQTLIDIVLEQDIKALEEIVVVGYGTVKKSDLTGSVASVKGEELSKQPITTIDQGLQGLAAGVQVQQTSGAPGGAVTLRIRGTNSISAGNEPLYVIDGLPILANNAATPASPSIVGFGDNSQPGQPPSPLSSISPNDIESIEILKDASATALYGARASNGVVLITTKRGKSGKGSITFDAYYGIQEISNQVSFMSADQHRSYLENAINSGASSLSPSDIPNANIDWIDLIQDNSSSIQNYTLGAQGGTEKVQYSVSANYFDQEGIIRNTGIDRYSMRLNLDFQPLQRLRMGVSSNIAYTENQIQIQNGTGNYQTTNSPFTWAQWLSPLQPIYDDEGNLLQDYFTGDAISNPEALVAEKVDNEILTFRTFGTLFAEYTFSSNFKYKINLGGDLSSGKRNSFFPSSHPFGRQVNGLGSVSNTLLTNWLLENLLSYELDLEDHDLNLIGGITAQQERIESSVLQGEDFEIDNLGYNSIQQAAIRDGVSGVNNWTLLSYFAQANYIFKSKYLLTANFRADGSSKFGRNNRWGYFPSVALAWQVHEEPFFNSLSNTISDLKIRTSYGVVGNQEIPANLAFASFSSSSPLNLTNDPESFGINGLVLASLANPDLKWETTTQLNVGLDMAFFDNRLNLTANYYQKITDDLLLATPLPATSGFNSAFQNIGQVENKGFEVSLNSINIDKELRWSTTLNLSSNKNRVTALAGDLERTFIGVGSLQNINTVFVLEVGQPLGAYYGYLFEGIYQSGDTDIPDGFEPGDPRYIDLSGPEGIPDGTITSEDQTVIGDPNPDMVFGFNNTFNYRGFDLTLFFNGEINKDVVNWNRTFWETGLVDFQRTPNAAEAWSDNNPSNEIPKVGFSTPISSQGGEAMSSRLVEDGTFLRLRNLTLGYTLPIQSNSLSSFRIYLTGQNLFTITNYTGFDPEANYSAGSAVIQGFDFGSYPLPRTYIFGIQARF